MAKNLSFGVIQESTFCQSSWFRPSSGAFRRLVEEGDGRLAFTAPREQRRIEQGEDGQRRAATTQDLAPGNLDPTFHHVLLFH